MALKILTTLRMLQVLREVYYTNPTTARSNLPKCSPWLRTGCLRGFFPKPSFVLLLFKCNKTVLETLLVNHIYSSQGKGLRIDQAAVMGKWLLQKELPVLTDCIPEL